MTTSKIGLVTLAALSLLGTTARADFTNKVEDQDRGRADLECAVVRVRPPEHDRNPGYKVELSINYNNGNATSFGVIHTLANGATYDRSKQYNGGRLQSWKDGSARWGGWYGNRYMVGTYNAITDTYVEIVHADGPLGRVVTTIETRCHGLADGDSPEGNGPLGP
jgi:hypothetical protein